MTFTFITRTLSAGRNLERSARAVFRVSGGDFDNSVKRVRRRNARVEGGPRKDGSNAASGRVIFWLPLQPSFGAAED